MHERDLSNLNEIPLNFTATEVSIIWQGINNLIKSQKNKIENASEPQKQSLIEHLERLQELGTRLQEINAQIEEKVVNDIKNK